MNCPFCNLDPKRNKLIYDGETVFVIPSNPRLVEGHLLVIPKRHIEKPFELNSEERKEILDTILKFQEKIVRSFSQGCDIQENYRPYTPQSETKVNHIHFHLIPRNPEDELSRISDKGRRELFHMINAGEVMKTARLFEE